MKKILNFIPLVFFLIFLLTFDIFAGVKALMISSAVVFFISWIIYKQIEKMEIVTFLMVMIFGGLTLYFDNEMFIKWKVSVINFAIGLFILISYYLFNKNFLKLILGKEIVLANKHWNTLILVWSFFFIAIGLINTYIIYYIESNEFFGLFKSFGIPVLTIIPAIITGIIAYKNNNNEIKE